MRIFYIFLFCMTLVLTSCFNSDTGSIEFSVNGEDFVQNGFIDKDGWAISFDHVYVNIENPTAYLDNQLKATLKGEHWVDLKAKDLSHSPIIGKIDGVKVGNYQSLKFSIVQKKNDPFNGSSVVMIGAAEKEGQKIPFHIQLNSEILFDGQDGYVGEMIKGIVKNNHTADVEMTFHFDHIFGDFEASQDSHINKGALGFEFFKTYQKDNRVKIDQDDLKNSPLYNQLIQSLKTLGHLGEGHCEATLL